MRKEFQHPLAEPVSVINWQARHNVERTSRIRAENALYTVQSRDQRIPPCSILSLDSIKIALWGVDSCLSRNLRNSRRTKPRLCKFQGRTPQFLVFGYQTTQPRPARAIPLGYGIKYDAVLLQPFQMHRRDKFPAVITKFPVRLDRKS